MKSIKMKFLMEKCFAGLNFLAIAIQWFSLEQDWRLWWVDAIAGVVILGYCIFICFVNPRIHYEPVDEMTKIHEWRAQATAFNGLCVVLAFFGLICLWNKTMRSLLSSFVLSWPFLFLALGIFNILEYILFLWIESSGDVIE